MYARGPGTKEMLADTGLKVTALGPGWEHVLTLRSHTGRDVACPSSTSLVSAGQAVLEIAFQ